MVKTIVTEKGLQVPIFHASYANGQGKFASEPLDLKNSVIEKILTPEQVSSLILVKLDKDDKDAKHLAERSGAAFEDGVKRSLIFSSGSNHYFGSKELKSHFHRVTETHGSALFTSQPDAACRYGGLLVSDCFKGIESFENLRIKLVDFEDPDYAAFKTGDCHGKISPKLARALNGQKGVPFQFRLAGIPEENAAGEDSPKHSFLAKGTFLPDSKLTDVEGYDIVLDRSSIKGVNKAVLEEWFPCSDPNDPNDVYSLPKTIIGNRNNAKTTSYDSSWQFNVWSSEEAILQDLGPATAIKVQELAQVQRNPLELAKYIVREHDKEQQRRLEQSENDEPSQNLSDEDSTSKSGQANSETEQRMVKILRADKYGQLLNHPKVASFMRDYVAGQWKDLAIKSGFKHSSGMALPAPELERGTVCIPHLPEGDVIITRYPIISQDNIRVYHNNPNTEGLSRTRNVVWIHPQDNKNDFQGDFDGDQLVVTPAKDLPNIAKETLRAGEPGRFIPVVQRPKRAYNEYTETNPDGEEQRKYTKLYEVAYAASQNSVGVIAISIGRIASATPADGEDTQQFEKEQRKLLGRLMPALQIEVDYTKNAERFTDVDHVTLPNGKQHWIGGAHLLEDCKTWLEDHPTYFFDFKKDEDRKLYRSHSFPANQDGALYALPREVINPAWEATRIPALSRNNFRYVFTTDLNALNLSDSAKECALDADDWAEEIINRAQIAIQDIAQRTNGNGKEFNEELGNLYESFRNEFHERFPSDDEKMVGAMILGNKQHSRPQYIENYRKDCLKVASTIPSPTFDREDHYILPSEAIPRSAYVLRVPFGERTLDWKDAIETHGIPYEAKVHPALPMVEFAFKNLEREYIDELESQFYRFETLIDDPKVEIPKNLQIVPPEDHERWLETSSSTGMASLVFNLCADQIAQRLEQMEIEPLTVLGVRRNDFAEENFNNWEDRSLACKVVPLALEPNHPDYLRYNGTAVIEVNGKCLGTLAPESPKLAMGSTFEATLSPKNDKAVFLTVNQASIALEQSKEQNRPDEGVSEATPLNQKLFAAIKRDYQKHPISGDQFFRIGTEGWKVYMMGNGDAVVRTADEKTVFRANLETEEIRKALSDEAEEKLKAMLSKRSRTNEHTPEVREPVPVNSKQPALAKAGIDLD